MDENLTVFADVTGGCERILRTPIPLSTTRHTARFLTIYLMLLPFALWCVCCCGCCCCFGVLFVVVWG